MNQPTSKIQTPCVQPPVTANQAPRPISTSASARPTAPLTTVARAFSVPADHRVARSMRPPSSGNAGSRLKTARPKFAQVSQADGWRSTGGSQASPRSKGSPNSMASARLTAGPAAAITSSSRARRGSSARWAIPPSRNKVMRAPAHASRSRRRRAPVRAPRSRRRRERTTVNAKCETTDNRHREAEHT